jgi:hypothetical protein
MIGSDLLLPYLSGSHGLELVIRLTEGGPPLFSDFIEPGGRFTIRYTHSVDRTPIWEEHSVDAEGNIYIEKERFVMFGAGMGHWEGHGVLTTDGEYQVIENIHKPIGNFILRVGTEEIGHTLILGDQQVNLSRLAPGRAVTISVSPVGHGKLPGCRLSRCSVTVDLEE